MISSVTTLEAIRVIADSAMPPLGSSARLPRAAILSGDNEIGQMVTCLVSRNTFCPCRSGFSFGPCLRYFADAGAWISKTHDA